MKRAADTTSQQFRIFRNESQASFLIIGIAIMWRNWGNITAMLDIRLIERGLQKPGKTKGRWRQRSASRPARCPKSCPGYA